MPCRILRVPAEMDSPGVLAWLKERKDPGLDVSTTVRSILDAVRKEGDQALRRYTRRFDAPDLPARMGVPVRAIRSALKEIPTTDLDILRGARWCGPWTAWGSMCPAARAARPRSSPA